MSDDLAAFVQNESHYPETEKWQNRPHCHRDGHQWPCEVSQLLTRLAAREAQLAEAQAMQVRGASVRQWQEQWDEKDRRIDAAAAQLQAVAEWAQVNSRILDARMIERDLQAILYADYTNHK